MTPEKDRGTETKAEKQKRQKDVHAELELQRWGERDPSHAVPTTPSPPVTPPAPRPHLGVGGPVDDLSLPQPDDGSRRLGVVCVAGEVEGVPCPQADHGSPQDDGVIGWHCGERRREVTLRGTGPAAGQAC